MASQALTVAVTGPTGDLGVALVDALERSRSVKRVVGFSRSGFDAKARGWKKTESVRGDVRQRGDVRSAVNGADAVVHLAFSLMGAGDATHEINVDGSRIVFEEAVKGGAERICYASSVAAYGFHEDNPSRLDEDVPARGSPEHFYSAHKAEVEQVLSKVLARKRKTTAYVYRPCIVAGPRAQMLIEEIPYVRLSESMPDPVRRLLAGMPVLKPVIPDPGIKAQLVHEDDVASAFMAGITAKGPPGAYNLAGSGTFTVGDLADALGWYTIPLPELAVEATAEVIARLPQVPEALSWIESVRTPVLMTTAKAKKQLKWRPKYSAKQTLKALVEAYRAEARER